MSEGKPPRLFISHHSSKLEVALQLEKALGRYGVKCWLAPRDIGPAESFDIAIRKAIEETTGILLLFCAQSDKSRHVKRELILADDAHKAIIPVRLENLAPDELKFHLANFQWIDWIEQREITIERIASKAHQLGGSQSSSGMVREHVGLDASGLGFEIPTQGAVGWLSPIKARPLAWGGGALAVLAMLLGVYWMLGGSGTDEQVVLVQRQLAALDYPVRETGTLDKQTAQAIRDFERDQKRPETGKIGFELGGMLEAERVRRDAERDDLLAALSRKWTTTDCAEAGMFKATPEMVTVKWPDIYEITDYRERVNKIAYGSISTEVVEPASEKGGRFLYTPVGDTLKILDIRTGKSFEMKACG